MVEGRAERAMRQRPVVETAIVFQPCRVLGVLVKVLRRNVVVLTTDHPAQARDEAGMAKNPEWEERVKGLLKAELKRRNVGYRELAEKLTAMGIPDNRTEHCE